MPPRVSLKLKALRAQIEAGTDALERNDFSEVDDADLERYLERLKTRHQNGGLTDSKQTHGGRAVASEHS